MATTVQASLSISSSCSKSITSTDITVSDPSINQAIGNYSGSFNSGVTPNGTESWSGLVTLSAGAATLNLASLTQAGLSGTFDMTGLKLRFIHVVATEGNANVISIDTGASNGYPIGLIEDIGAADHVARTYKTIAAVGASTRTIDFAGTGTQSIKVLLVFGT